MHLLSIKPGIKYISKMKNDPILTDVWEKYSNFSLKIVN